MYLWSILRCRIRHKSTIWENRWVTCRYRVDIKVVFGNVLRQARKEKEISQEQLAFDAGLDRSYVSKLETGVYQPSISTLFAISAVLQVKPSMLVAQVEQKIKIPAASGRGIWCHIFRTVPIDSHCEVSGTYHPAL